MWKYGPSKDNLADLRSREALIDKMKKGDWFNASEWLVEREKWPKQPKLERTKNVLDEQNPMTEAAFKTYGKGT